MIYAALLPLVLATANITDTSHPLKCLIEPECVLFKAKHPLFDRVVSSACRFRTNSRDVCVVYCKSACPHNISYSPLVGNFYYAPIDGSYFAPC